MVYNYIADWQAFVAEVAANFAYVRLFRSKYVRIRADDTSSRFPSFANYSFRPVRTCTRYFHWKKQNLFPSLFDLSSTHSSGAKVNGEEKKKIKKRERKKKEEEYRSSASTYSNNVINILLFPAFPRLPSIEIKIVDDIDRDPVV